MNIYYDKDADLEIIPIINKIDIQASDIDSSIEQLVDLLGCKEEEILKISAKSGIAIQSVFNAINHINTTLKSNLIGNSNHDIPQSTCT